MRKQKFIKLLMIFLLSNYTHAQLFGGWILSEDLVCISGDGSGSSIANASWSCKEIKQNFPTSSDGLYFLDVDGVTGPLVPFLGYCDMTTDGGGWLLIAKAQFSAFGPSKIEMTGDVNLVGSSIDPWSGGTMIPSINTDVGEFTTSSTPDYFPVAYRGNALHTEVNNIATQAPTENYASISREIIEAYRTNPCTSGSSTNDSRNKTVIRQRSGVNIVYIQSPKRFNQIQHKCATTTIASICNQDNTTGCATDFISEGYSSYNAATHIAFNLRIGGGTGSWTALCNGSYSNGLDATFLLPSAWFSAKSSFYDLSRTNSATSGPVTESATYFPDFSSILATTESPYTTYWIK